MHFPKKKNIIKIHHHKNAFLMIVVNNNNSSVILYKDVSALLFTFGIIVHTYSLHSSLSI
jgi:hypothetical protein